MPLIAAYHGAMKEKAPPPKVPAEDSVAGEEDPGASLDVAGDPVNPPQPPPKVTPRQDEKPAGG